MESKKKQKSNRRLNPVHAVILLDETASMQSCKHETISAFNEYVKGLKGAKTASEIYLTLVTFNSEHRKTVFANRPLPRVPELTEESYKPGAITPLYDAAYATIGEAEKKSTGKDVLFIIVTDGQENASQEIDRPRIFELIQKKKHAGWTFVFLAANQD